MRIQDRQKVHSFSILFANNYLRAIEGDSEMSEVGESSKAILELLTLSNRKVLLDEVQHEFSIWLHHCVGEQRHFTCILDVQHDALSLFVEVVEAAALALHTLDELRKTSLPDSEDGISLCEWRLVATDCLNLFAVELLSALACNNKWS